MRILHVITRREMRGAEVVATDLCEQLAQRGHAVLLAGLFQPPNRAEADNLTRRLPGVLDLGGRKHRGLDLRVLRALLRAVREFQPDVVQANAFNALKFSALARLATRARWPLVYRNVGVAGQWVTFPFQRAWGRFLLRQVRQVVSVSDASRDDFARTYGVPAEQILVARQGVRLPAVVANGGARRRLASAAGCPDEVALLVHVGNFAPEKNHAGLIEAFQRVHRECPRSRLLLVGDGPLRTAIESQTRTAELGNVVHFLGCRADVPDLLVGADVLLIASHVEGIPGCVLEAYAAAVPVVATRVGGLAEIVQENVTGFLVPPGDMDALAAATCRLLGDPSQRRRMGQTAREFVGQHYSLERSVDELESLYLRLLGDGRSAACTCGSETEAHCPNLD